ncbi:Metal tolerance 9 [Hyphodiscus hymeniophilus]|uniref:Metal tolerance 9 n=1 Tax=Hyphodiscus hymeniophilus TaxID=353542 RepID=A0A9P6VK17_9HELO|nr:Metal tolerance 9 [Hyphodiscus hymeniophilus]
MVVQRQRSLGASRASTADRRDTLSGTGSSHPRRTWFAGRYGFKDDILMAAAEQRRQELKDRILAGVKDFNVEKYRKSDSELKAIKNRNVRAYYEAQNQKLNDWAEVDSLVWSLADDVVDSTNPDADHDGIVDSNTPLKLTGDDLEAFLPTEEREKRVKSNRTARTALNVNVSVNVLLLVAKIIAVTSTQSLSLIASLTDSALDLLCTMIIWITSQLARRKRKSLNLRFPVGRRRLEPLGNLVFSILMVISFLQILQESVGKLLPSGSHETLILPPVAIGAMAGNVVIKGLVGLLYFQVKNSQVQALVQDCKTDVYFNTATLLFPLIGRHFDIWYLDPLGAAILSLFVIYDWANTSLSTIIRLTGTAVPIEMEKKLMYLAWRFSPVVDSYKSMTAYHAGDGIMVEVDITLDESTSLPRAHDVSQTMQYCFEGLAEVDRSFVTVDYSALGLRGHAAGSG